MQPSVGRGPPRPRRAREGNPPKSPPNLSLSLSDGDRVTGRDQSRTSTLVTVEADHWREIEDRDASDHLEARDDVSGAPWSPGDLNDSLRETSQSPGSSCHPGRELTMLRSLDYLDHPVLGLRRDGLSSDSLTDWSQRGEPFTLRPVPPSRSTVGVGSGADEPRLTSGPVGGRQGGRDLCGLRRLGALR